MKTFAKQVGFSLPAVVFLAVLTACGGSSSSGPGPAPQTATPSFSLPAGSYTSAQTVNLTDSTAGATIYYTTDGSAPTTSSTQYTAAVRVSASETLSAIAVASGYTNSTIASAAYTITMATTPSYTWKNAQIVAGGFITGFVAHPTQQNLFYVRTDIGGAYRWNAATSSWIPLTDWITRANSNYIGIESIGLDPSDPQRLYLAAGTYDQSWGGTGAILVSSDQGNTFQTVPMTIKMGSNDDGREAGERLAVDPNLGSIVYFGSRLNGLWKSTDHGSTWNQVGTFPVTGPTTGAKGDGVGVIFVDFIASSGSSGTATPVIYVGVSDTGTEATPVYSLYRSIDSGNTWTAVPGQPTGLYPNHGVFGPDGNLYLSYGDDIGPNGLSAGAVWKYTPPANSSPNGNGTWTNITPPAPSYTNNGSYGYGIVVVDPEQPGVIMVSSLDLWYLHDDIWRSTNGGSTWDSPETGANSTFDGSLSPWITALQLDGGANQYPGWWIGAMVIDPFNSNHVLYGTGATIWATTDATNADSGRATNWSVGALGLEETAVTQLISPPSGANLVSGLGDICGFVHTTLTASPPAGMMVNPQFSTTSGLDFAQSAPATMARVGYNGSAGPFGAYSTNGGTSWTPFPSQPAGVTTTGAGSIAVSADGSTFVWAPGDSGAGVAYTTNQGTTWTASTGAPANQTVVADRFNAKKFYVFNPGANALWESTDGGKTFAQSAASLPNQGTLVASFAAEGDLWLASNNGLYHSTNSGTSFSLLSNVQQAYAVGFGMAASGEPYPAIYLLGQVGGTQGFFRSIDAGTVWVQINDAAHEFGNANLIIGDPRIFGRVYIGTNGLGIIYGDSPN